jgi:phosphatidylserine/phosphatidylglycerophosphate/cardiolipin synthase-like enzyme
LGAISDGRALPNEPGAAVADSKAKKQGAPASRSGKRAGAKKTKTATKKKRPRTRRRPAAMVARVDVIRSARVAHPVKRGKPGRAAASTKGSRSMTGTPQPKRAIYQNPKAPDVLMIRAAAIGDFDLIGNWEHEMLKYGQAIIHDKIVVIDPLSDDCVVITGSHNLGYKASYANDENMLIIKGNRALAAAYMVHVLDVYDHYKFRAILEQQAYERLMGKPGQKPPVGKGILETDDSWQDKYVKGKPTREQSYFLNAPMPGGQ